MAAPPGTPPPPARSLAGQPDGAAAAPVDWPGLLESLDGDQAFARELAQTYIDSGNGLLAELAKAIELRDCAAAASSAHALKGASANMRAARVADAAARLEAAARAGETDRLEALAATLRRDFAAAADYLRSAGSSG